MSDIRSRKGFIGFKIGNRQISPILQTARPSDRVNSIPINPSPSHHSQVRPLTARLTEPTVPELAANFTIAMARWAAKGFPIITSDQKAIRDQICGACDEWAPKAYAGWGKCKVCGCGKVKRLLATQSCPKGKWPPLTPPKTSP